MKTCIIYGVDSFERRRWIENFIDTEKYKIIGYSDGIQTEDIIDGRKFFDPEKLPEVDFDFVIVNSLGHKNEIKKKLMELGIEKQKIITLELFKHSSLNNGYIVYDIKRDMEKMSEKRNEVETLIFGMSEAAKDISVKDFPMHYYNFGGTARDIYYNYSQYRFANKKGFFQKANVAIFILPYWSFGYDMSIDVAQYQNHSILTEMLLYGDLHHGKELHNEVISNSIRNYELFGKRLLANYHWSRIIPITKETISSDYRIEIDSRWNKRSGIEKENVQLFNNHLTELNKNGVDLIYIVVPPCYCQFNELSKKDVDKIKRTKEQFYNCCKSSVGDSNVSYIDGFDLFSERQYFHDMYHLNSYGAECFSKWLYKKMSGEVRDDA